MDELNRAIFQYFKYPLKRHFCNYEIDMPVWNVVTEHFTFDSISLAKIHSTLDYNNKNNQFDQLIYDLKCVSIYCNVLQHIKTKTSTKRETA